jgi:hypothetical protein
MIKEESMRKKGENSVNCAGRAAIPPDANESFHAWCRKSNTAWSYLRSMSNIQMARKRLLYWDVRCESRATRPYALYQ